MKINKSLTRYRVRDDSLDYENGYNVEFLEPKTVKSNRIVPLNKKAIAMQEEMKKTI